MSKGGFGSLNRPADQLIKHSVADQLVRRRSGKLLPTGVVVRGAGGMTRGKRGRVRKVLPMGGKPPELCLDGQGHLVPCPPTSLPRR